MTTSTIRAGNEATSSKFPENARESWLATSKEKAIDRAIETEPKRHSWMIVAAGAVVPLGLAGAAVATTYLTRHERVAVAAWVAVAIVGSASVMSASAVSHRRTMANNRENHGSRRKEQIHDHSTAEIA